MLIPGILPRFHFSSPFPFPSAFVLISPLIFFLSSLRSSTISSQESNTRSGAFVHLLSQYIGFPFPTVEEGVFQASTHTMYYSTVQLPLFSAMQLTISPKLNKSIYICIQGVLRPP